MCIGGSATSGGTATFVRLRLPPGLDRPRGWTYLSKLKPFSIVVGDEGGPELHDPSPNKKTHRRMSKYLKRADDNVMIVVEVFIHFNIC